MNRSDRQLSALISINLALAWCSVAALLTFARLGSADFGAQGDLPVHYHLLRAYWRSAQAGDWLPQWAGLLDGGRGDAFFTFYPPLSYWLGALLIKFGGLSFIGSLKCLTFFSIFLAQLNAYILARSFFARLPSLLVSLSYALLLAGTSS